MNRPAAGPLSTPPPLAWRADLRQRFWRYLPLKVVGISGFMWVFFLGYFHTLRHPAYPVFEMPLTALDALLPFQPWGLVAYVSLWLYVGVAPGLLLRLRELIVYGLWAGALCAAGLLIFHFWPTAVPRPDVDVSAYPGFAVLQGVDAAGNACPSLHVATAVFTAIWVERLMRIVGAPMVLRLLNLAWVLAIAWSTVAIRQHVVLDAVAGAALGSAFAALSIRLSPWVGRGQAA
ncbi:phosphatase PAP2 family protein [Rubrivivax rivuli]|uniref:phosphatase PAP2 family protein n=1 Tax=Rubrivivax rivuli TaxID=1862385 RepID=UPI0013E32188|nr:phosphatase PAP2 family protein [Rubrivivax rivuli]